MSRKRIPEGVFSITHYLSKRKKTDNEGSPAAGNTKTSMEKKPNTVKNKINKNVKPVKKLRSRKATNATKAEGLSRKVQTQKFVFFAFVLICFQFVRNCL